MNARRVRRVLLLGATGGVALVLGTVVVGYLVVDVPVPADAAVREATVVRYADGAELARVGKVDRRLVRLEQVDADLQHAVLAAEDRGFYDEPGISPKGMARALLANVRGGGVEEGGSTITQQYAKNAFLTTERSLGRKVKEVFIALKMDRQRSKAEILEDYLNTVYFGRGAYGVQVAARTYFGTDAKDLTPAQAAVLASSIRSPAAYDPQAHPERARARWAYVLDGMVAKGWLGETDRARATYPEVLPKGANRRSDDRSGPTGYVLAQVEAELARHGLGEDALERGGLTVQTTLRKRAQDAAIGAVKAVVPKPEQEDQSALQAALVAVKPGTGEVFAYYGGRTGNGGFDYAAQGPQDAGSTMKPWVLAAALDKGISLRTTMDGRSPQTFPGYDRPVRNVGDQSLGQVDLVEATAKSVNTVFVPLAQQVGPARVAELARAAGIRDRLADEDGTTRAGVALGVYGVRVVDQAAAMATLAARGNAARPFFVKRVTDSSGQVVHAYRAPVRRAVREDVAADVTFALQQVVARGTASGNGRLDGRPAIGKTGTTQDSRDAWMVGAVPQLSAAVWMGRGDNAPMGRRTGGGDPARIWKAFLDAALQGQPVRSFPARADVGTAPSPTPSASPSPSPSPSPSASPSASPSPSPLPVELVVAPPPSPEPTASDPYASPYAEPTQDAAADPYAEPAGEPSPQPYDQPYDQPYEDPYDGSSEGTQAQAEAEPSPTRRGRGRG